MPDLTAVTVTKDDPSGLERTLSSLLPLADAGFGWEVVVVDGSETVNHAVLEQFSTLPVRLVMDAGKGIYAALNQGVEVARGKYVWMLNGGDELADAEALREGLLTAVRNRIDLYCFGAAICRNGEQVFTQFPSANLTAATLARNHICHQAMLFSREIFDRAGNFDTSFRLAGDHDHILRCRWEGASYAADRRVAVRYHMGGASSVHWLAVHSESLRAILRSRRCFSFAEFLRQIVVWFVLLGIILVKKCIRALPGGTHFASAYNRLRQAIYNRRAPRDENQTRR
jgi:glycosyltransferase involved in cell wall biosynthesis